MAICFIDTNIFMYAVGSSHPFKEPCEKLIESLIRKETEGSLNVEVLQEILYRYQAIGKPKIGFDLFDTIIKTFPIIWQVSKEDLIEAKKIQQKYTIKIRDAIHAATMKRNRVTSLYSYDTDFDLIPGIKRLTP